MPSGITHILLMKNLQSVLPTGELKAVLAAGKYFLQVGAVGPDLPYSSIVDGDLIFSDQSDLADKFHYVSTNKIPLIAFHKIKEIPTSMAKERRFSFCFFAGYMCHIVADGIIHPFIRDMVGNYSENQTKHRILEMQLDVILNNYFTGKSGTPTEYNYTNIHDELKNISDYQEVNFVAKLFSDTIKEVYNLEYSTAKILGWIVGLHRLFSVASGEHPRIYRNMDIFDGVLFKNYDDIEEKKETLLTLRKPVDGVEENFIKAPMVHFISECIPQFYKIVVPLLNKAYDYALKNGDPITEQDILSVDLDTGRDLAFANDLNKIPSFWS